MNNKILEDHYNDRSKKFSKNGGTESKYTNIVPNTTADDTVNQSQQKMGAIENKMAEFELLYLSVKLAQLKKQNPTTK